MLATLLLFAPAAAAESETGLAFAREQPLELSWEEFLKGTELTVCNGSRLDAKPSAEAVEFHFKKEEEPLADSAVVTLEAGNEIAPGRCGKLSLQATETVVSTGSYPGVLVVTAPGVGVARLAATIEGPPGSSEEATVSTPPEKTTLHAISSAPGADSKLQDGGEVLLPKPEAGEEDPELGRGCVPPSGAEPWPDACAFIGNLYQGTEVIHVYIAGEARETMGAERLPVRFESGVHAIGTYEGTLDPGLTGEKEKLVSVVLSASDAWWCALAAVIVGVLLTLWFKVISSRYLPRKRLRLRADAIGPAYAPGGTPLAAPGHAGMRADPGKVDRYVSDVRKAIDDYTSKVVLVDVESDAYKKIDASLVLAHSDARALGDVDGLAKALDDLKAGVESTGKLLAECYGVRKTPDLLAAAGAPLVAAELGVGEASERAKRAKELSSALAEWQKMAKLVFVGEALLIAVGERANNEKSPFEGADRRILAKAAAEQSAVRAELFHATTHDDLERLRVSNRVETAFGRLTYLCGKYQIQRPAPAREMLEKAGANVAKEVSGSFPALVDRTFPPENRPDAWEVGQVHSSSASAATISAVKWWVPALDLVVIILGVFPAIIAALQTNFFGQTFGTFEDYLILIAAGAVAQGVVTLVLGNFGLLLHDIRAETDVVPAAATVSVQPTAPASS
jgi:hypothetical protein